MQNKPKIFESPDGGKTVYEREFGSNTRKEIKKEIKHPQELLTKKILPPDIFYKVFSNGS